MRVCLCVFLYVCSRALCPAQRQELESENKKLKHNLNDMRQLLSGNAGAGSSAPGSPAYKVLLEQLNSANEELDVRKDEVLILRSQLVSHKEAMQHKVGASRGRQTQPCSTQESHMTLINTAVSCI